LRNIAIIPARGGSKRIPKKNIKNFMGSPAISYAIKAALKSNLFDTVMVSTDSKEIAEIGVKYGAKIDRRLEKFATDHVPMRDVYKYLANKIETKYACYLHVTSPFLKDRTLQNAKRFFFKQKKFNCLASVTEVKEYLWYKNKALNYNPKKHPRSQDLPSYYGINFAINIFSTEFMKKKGRIIGEKFYPLVLRHPETLDIDHQWQFDIGNIIANQKNTN